MNANELADVMEKYSTAGFMTPLADEFKQAATMLRQQKAEIEALKKEAALQRLSDFTQEAEKTLTDEEIESWITEWAKDLYGTLYVEPTDHQRTMAIKMARAILRKAQEK